MRAWLADHDLRGCVEAASLIAAGLADAVADLFRYTTHRR